MTLSFTLQDILGSFLAFFLFSLVFVIPGYVLGWGLNLFDFRNRLLAVRYLLGIVLSNVLSPILLFLVYFLGAKIAILLVFMLAIAWGLIEFLPCGQGKPAPSLSPDAKRYQRIAIAVAGA
jgi:hypothetical protein